MKEFDFETWLRDVADGSQAKAARLLGVSRAAVAHWRKGSKNITPERQEQMIAVAQQELRKLSELYRGLKGNDQGLTDDGGEAK